MYGFCSVIWKWLHFYPPDVYIKQLSRYRAFLQIRRGLAMSKCTCKNLADGTCGTSNFCNGVMVCLLILLHWIVYSCLTKFDSFGEYLSKKNVWTPFWLLLVHLGDLGCASCRRSFILMLQKQTVLVISVIVKKYLVRCFGYGLKFDLQWAIHFGLWHFW